MYYRRKIIAALLQLFEDGLTSKQLQKYLFLFSREQEEKSFDFVPYYYGCFSFQANQDAATMVKTGILSIDDAVLGERKLRLCDGYDYFTMLDMFDQQTLMSIKDNFGGMSQDELIRYTYLHYPYYATKSTIAKDLLSKEELKEVERQKRHFEEPCLFTIGYEGKSLERYINLLIINDVHVLCDVRKNAYSQKYGFSKSQLEKACTGTGIKYIHIPQLGIESNLRQSLNTQSDYDRLFDLYEATTLLYNWKYLLDIKHLIDSYRRIALTCFEANPKQCHRTRIANHLMDLPDKYYNLKHL